VTELRVVVPDQVAERLASEAKDRGTSAEDVAAEVLTLHFPAPAGRPRIPSWVGAMHSARHDLSEHHEEVLKSELGKSR
jgi:hypothetical protein